MSCFRAVMDTIWPESRGYGHCGIAEIIVSGSMERAHSSRVETDAPSEGLEAEQKWGTGAGSKSWRGSRNPPHGSVGIVQVLSTTNSPV
jgi:hypothetical protein